MCPQVRTRGWRGIASPRAGAAPYGWRAGAAPYGRCVWCRRICMGSQERLGRVRPTHADNSVTALAPFILTHANEGWLLRVSAGSYARLERDCKSACGGRTLRAACGGRHPTGGVREPHPTGGASGVGASGCQSRRRAPRTRTCPERDRGNLLSPSPAPRAGPRRRKITLPGSGVPLRTRDLHLPG